MASTDLIITAADVAEFQAQAEAEMQDTCRITIPGEGPRVLDEETGQYVDPARIIIYGPGAVDPTTGDPLPEQSGKCRLQVKADINSNVVETTAGEREWTYLTAQLQVPVAGTGHIPIDAVAEMLTAAFDDSLPGRKFNIQGTYHKSKPVIRRFRVREAVA